MPNRQSIFESKACRHNMVLVRCREGVLPTGQPTDTDPVLAKTEHPVHIVHTHRIKDPYPGRDDPKPNSLQEITNADPWETCCGTVFAPGTVEPVEWGGDFGTHGQCVQKSGETLSFMERVFREARDTELRYSNSFSEEDMDTSIAALNTVFAERNRDWVCDDEGDFWTYEASFNGVFSGDRLEPRTVDLGLERLTVQIPLPGTAYIHSCGVRDGCPKHLARTTAFPLTDREADLEALNESVSAHEEASTLFDLQDLAWCLIQGDCSKTPVYWN